jgi:hypothetical protein
MQLITSIVTVRWQTSGAFALLVVVLALASCDSKPPEIYEIPQGYSGWVEILYRRQACAPLPHSHGATVFAIPATGVLCTSSPHVAGLGREEFLYVNGAQRTKLQDLDGDQRMIWNVEYYFSGSGTDQHDPGLRFFVGTKREYDKTRSH